MNARRFVIAAAACALVAAGVAPRAQTGGTFQGNVDLVYRSVSIDGSPAKFDEDFDGLESGVRLGQLNLSWRRDGQGFADWARLSLNGLGGEPFQYSSLAIGRQDSYKLELSHRQQSYLYNLLQVTDDLDGHAWDTESRITDLDLTLYVHDNVDVLLGFDEVRRSGSSLFMKDVQRDVFLMDTPIDRETRRLRAGVQIKAGPARIFFEQMLQRYDNQFNNTTENDQGLEEPDTTLQSYSWIQNDSRTADLTTIRVWSPLGDRVDLSVSYFGDLIGDDNLDSRVFLDANGTDFNGNPFVISGASNFVSVEQQTDLIDVDLAIAIVDPVTLHLQYRTLQRDAESAGTARLLEDPNNPGTYPPVPISTSFEYSLDVATGLLEVRPIASLTLRAGYRTIDRELLRDGFEADGAPDPFRNEDYKSDGDETFIYGFAWRARNWLRLSADYTDGEVERPFTSVSIFESEQLRARAVITPSASTRITLGYTDFENENTAITEIFSTIGGPVTRNFPSRSEGTSLAAAFSQTIGDRLDWSLAYTQQETDFQAALLLDTSAFLPCSVDFSACQDGTVTYDTDSSAWTARVNARFTDAWEGFARISVAEADGDDLLFGASSGLITSGLTGSIDQDYRDLEVGVTRVFASGLYVGGSWRVLDYEDVNTLLDYDGNIVTARAGVRF